MGPGGLLELVPDGEVDTQQKGDQGEGYRHQGYDAQGEVDGGGGGVEGRGGELAGGHAAMADVDTENLVFSFSVFRYGLKKFIYFFSYILDGQKKKCTKKRIFFSSSILDKHKIFLFYSFYFR